MNKMRRIASVLGGLFLGLSAAHAATLKVGDSAPDFTAPSTDGPAFHLKDHLGPQPIVLYFYPKDNTPGCTTEACGLRDNFAAFRRLNAAVYGVSYDSIASHQAFIKRYNLPFALLSDADKRIAQAYGADGLLFARRMTFVIDAAGKIAWMNPSVKPAEHSAELEKVLAGLNDKPR